jgi:hypothetical protein
MPYFQRMTYDLRHLRQNQDGICSLCRYGPPVPRVVVGHRVNPIQLPSSPERSRQNDGDLRGVRQTLRQPLSSSSPVLDEQGA